MECFSVTLSNIVTLHESFGASNISAFVNASGTAFPTGDLAALPDGPTTVERDANPYHAAVAVTYMNGSVKRLTPPLRNGYTFFARGSVEAVRCVTARDYEPGFRNSLWDRVHGKGLFQNL